MTSDNSNNDDLLCQTKPWQTQKLLDLLFHHETEISNIVILRNLVLCHRWWWCPRCSSWWAPGVTGTIFPDQTCLQLRGSAAPPAPSPGGPQSPSSIRSGGIFTPILGITNQPSTRLNSGDARGSFSRQAARRRTVKEAAMAPSEGTAITIGQGAVAGGAALGLGALAFYGLGMSGEVGAVDRAVGWPQYVKDRVRKQFLLIFLAAA